MKKIMFFIMAVLMLSACCETCQTTSETVHASMSRLVIKPTDGYARSVRVIEFGYNEHDYIMFLGTESMSVVHNPNCSCMNKVETTEILF